MGKIKAACGLMIVLQIVVVSWVDQLIHIGILYQG